MAATNLRCRGDCPGDGASGRGRLDDLVDHADLDSPRQATRESLVLDRQLVLDLRTVLFRDFRKTSTMQDAHGRDGAHDGDRGGRPREYPGRA